MGGPSGESDESITVKLEWRGEVEERQVYPGVLVDQLLPSADVAAGFATGRLRVVDADNRDFVYGPGAGLWSSIHLVIEKSYDGMLPELPGYVLLVLPRHYRAKVQNAVSISRCHAHPCETLDDLARVRDEVLPNLNGSVLVALTGPPGEQLGVAIGDDQLRELGVHRFGRVCTSSTRPEEAALADDFSLRLNEPQELQHMRLVGGALAGRTGPLRLRQNASSLDCVWVVAAERAVAERDPYCWTNDVNRAARELADRADDINRYQALRGASVICEQAIELGGDGRRSRSLLAPEEVVNRHVNPDLIDPGLGSA